MKGRCIGTVTGFTIVPEMKKVPGMTDVKLYDTSDALHSRRGGRTARFRDAGRADGDYMILQNPSWGLKQIPVVHDDAFPQLTSKQHTVMGMNQDNHDLFDAVNAGVAWLWKSKTECRTAARNTA